MTRSEVCGDSATWQRGGRGSPLSDSEQCSKHEQQGQPCHLLQFHKTECYGATSVSERVQPPGAVLHTSIGPSCRLKDHVIERAMRIVSMVSGTAATAPPLGVVDTRVSERL